MGLVRRVLTSFIEEDQGGAQIYQRADGSIEIPEMLRPYMKGMAQIG